MLIFRLQLLVIALGLFSSILSAQSHKVLFDNTKVVTAGNADGATDSILILNMSLWLARSAPVVTPPAQVTLSYPPDGSTEITIPTLFIWHSAPSASNYEFDLSTSNSFEFCIVQDTTLTDTAITISSLDVNTIYYWRVRAKNAAGWGAYSTPRSFTTWSTPPPVVLVSPIDSAADVPTPTVLTWHIVANPAAIYFANTLTTKSTGVSPGPKKVLNPPPGGYFNLDVSTSNVFSSFVFRDSTLIDSTKTVQLVLGTTYYWRVRASNGAGWGPYNPPRSFTTWDVPSQVVLDLPSDGGIINTEPASLRWHPVSSATSYQCEVSTSANFDLPIVSDSTLVDSMKDVSGLDTSVAYYWHVRGRNGAGWGEYSATRSFHRSNEEYVMLNVNRGWNLISIPCYLDDAHKHLLFPTAISDAFLYNGSYVQQDILTPGPGYWIKFSAPQPVSIFGRPRTNDTLDVTEGWNLVGTLSTPVPATLVTSDPPGIIASPFFGFESSYLTVDTLKPLQGYWVKASQPGKIILSK